MTNQQILEKAIQKAIDGGLDKGFGLAASELLPQAFTAETTGTDNFVRGIIFDHDFAKALWGEQLIQIINMEPAWRYHLQQMVVAEDPIAYLGENI